MGASPTSSTSISGRCSPWQTRPSASAWGSFWRGASSASPPPPDRARCGAPARSLPGRPGGRPQPLGRSPTDQESERAGERQAEAGGGAGEVVESAPPQMQSVVPSAEAIALEVVYEDADLMVINKPAGMVVHPAPGHYSGRLVRALLGRGGTWSAVGGVARPGIVHRLDMGTSGLIVVARNDVSHRALASQLSDRTLSRSYLAIARGILKADAGELEGPIGRHPKDGL